MQVWFTGIHWLALTNEEANQIRKEPTVTKQFALRDKITEHRRFDSKFRALAWVAAQKVDIIAPQPPNT